MTEEQASLFQEFLAETAEHLQNAEAGLLQLEADPNDPAVVQEIMRAMHTIKGNAGFFGFEEMTEISHHLEHLLVEVREGRAVLDGQAMHRVLTGVDQLKALLSELTTEWQTGGHPEASMTEADMDEVASERYLLFTSGHLMFALPISEVVEVTYPRPITRLPYVGEEIAGLINLRGTVVPQIDLSRKLWGGQGEVQHLVVVAWGRGRLALAVTRVVGVVTLDLSSVTADRQVPWAGRVVLHDGIPVALLELRSVLQRLPCA